MAAKLTFLEELVRRARRRTGLQTIAAGVFQALSAALVAAAVMLVAGTDLVAWYLPVLVFVAVLGAILWIRRRALPREYDTAQRLDSLLQLGDLLSSAWYAAHRCRAAMSRRTTGTSAGPRKTLDPSRENIFYGDGFRGCSTPLRHAKPHP